MSRSNLALRLHLVEAARTMEDQMTEWWAEELFCSITYNNTYLYERLTGVYSAYFDKRLKK